MDGHLEVRFGFRLFPSPQVLASEGANSKPPCSSMKKLAPKHLDTLFLRADVANVPFLVTKLAIKTLPCVIGFVDGTTKMK